MQNVSKAGQEILKQIRRGDVTTAEFTGGRARALAALKRGKLVVIKPVEVDGLVLSKQGEQLLSGKSDSGSRSASAEGHRDGSKAAQATKIIAKWSGKLKRGELIAKLVKQVGLTENSASTYIYNYGKQH